jgi:hypothetical protein
MEKSIRNEQKADCKDLNFNGFGFHCGAFFPFQALLSTLNIICLNWINSIEKKVEIENS